MTQTAGDRNLPEGWITAVLEGVTEPLRDGSHNPPVKRSSGSPMLSARNVENGKITFAECRFISEKEFQTEYARTQIEVNDVLLTIVGSIGRSAIVTPELEPFALQRSVAVAKPILFDPKFLMYHFQSPSSQRFLEERAAGTAQKGVYLKTLGTMPINLAPLKEQERIVRAIDDLLSHVEIASGHLSRVPVILKRFRQAVLAAACCGRLTENWRGLTPSATPSSTTGSSEYAGVEPLFDLPPSWRWVSFESVCEEITVGHVGPMAHEYQEAGIPFLRSQNVREFRFDPTGLKYVSRKFHLKLDKSALHPGDVVVVRSGYAGVACVIPDSIPEANCADLVVIRPSTALDPHYACMFINSNAGRAHVDEVKVGIAQSHFNIGAAKKTPLPLPPLAEQQEIVRCISGLFRLADTIEKRIATATLRANKLTQSILAKAFRGELVSTEAELARREGREYETASVLLERIKKERESQTSAKPVSKRTRPKAKLATTKG